MREAAVIAREVQPGVKRLVAYLVPTSATDPAPAGTLCGADQVCNASGSCVLRVVINEIESSGGTPGDWVELFNAGAAPADVSGWTFLDNDDAHTPYVIPAATIIDAGGYLLLEEARFGFGLGSGQVPVEDRRDTVQEPGQVGRRWHR